MLRTIDLPCSNCGDAHRSNFLTSRLLYLEAPFKREDWSNITQTALIKATTHIIVA